MIFKYLGFKTFREERAMKQVIKVAHRRVIKQHLEFIHKKVKKETFVMTVIIKGHLPQVTDMASLLSTGEINKLNKIVE